MDYKTHQIAMINKSLLAQKIRELQGLSSDEKSQLLGLINDHKRYGLVWEDKVEEVEEQLQEQLPILNEVTYKRILSTEEDAPNHILIEGDNLHALTCLSYTHEGKIDVIYIDPPYNTGNKDFVYNDSYVDSEDDFRHSKWLSFMNKRLRIARRLLSDNGVIFISIDDNEQAALKLLCDEVFGERNFVATYFWKRTSTPPALSYKVRRKLEYVLCFQKKDIPQRTFAQGYVDGGDVPLLNTGNPLGILTFPRGSVHFGINDGVYSHKANYKIELLDEIIVKNGVNINDFRARGHFKWGQTNLNNEVANGTYFLIKSLQFSPRFQKAVKATKVPSNIIDEEVFVGTNEDAQKELLEFKLSETFDYAKPTSLVSYLSKMPFWEDRNITILDFFAGSGTTMHAVMQLNNEDGGKRQCILVTNNENGICENITYERNRRVIQGYTNSKGERVEGLSNNNLRYYQTNYVPRERTQRNMRSLVNAATDLLCIQNNLYEEQDFLIDGKKVSKSIARYFGEMLVVYREEFAEEIAKAIEGMEIKGKKLKVYIFSPGRYAFDDTFIDVQDKVELVALPAAIYDAYKHVLPKRREKLLEEPQPSVPTDLFSEL